MNESIAPNEYIVASRSAWPGSSAIEAMIEKVMIATCGVRYFGWTWRSRSGSWRCWPIEKVSRETPIIPAFVAITRITAARTPT